MSIFIYLFIFREIPIRNNILNHLHFKKKKIINNMINLFFF